MNSLQQELNNINQQLEHLNARKAQLEPIISEYSDVINRVKNLTENMIALNIEPTNLRFDLEDILEGNEAGDWVREADIFASEPDTTPELTPEPTPQPVKMFAFVPGFPISTPALTQEPTPEPTPEPDSEECSKCEGEGVIESAIEEDQICPACGGTGEKPEPQPEPVQINMQAYRRNDTLLIGFTNKRLMNQWSKWFKSSWGDQVHVSDHSDNLQGFNHCLTVLWFGNPHWERLTKLNYSLKPTEQNQSSVTVANSEEE